MICFIKSLNVRIDVSNLLKNEMLNFPLPIDERTGEIIKRNRSVYYNDLLFTITPKNILKIQGSLHKYFNNGLHNFNDFTFNDFIDVLTDLKTKFGILPENVHLNNLEFGVNLVLPYSPSLFIDELLNHKGQNFNVTKRNGKHYAECQHGQYVFKIYHKGLKHGHGNILRIELHYSKSQPLNKDGIYTLSDLMKVEVWQLLGKKLLEQFESIIYFDSIASYNQLNESDRSIIDFGSNPRNWNKFNNRSSKKNKVDRFKYLVSEYGENEFHKIGEMIIAKVNELINPEKVNVFTTFKNQSENDEINVLTYILSCNIVKPDILTIQSSDSCLITGLSISMQKDESKLLSHSGLKYYFENDKISFEIVKRKFLSKTWDKANIDIQIKEIAHNIRNKYNNMKLKQSRIHPKGQISLFIH